VIIKKFNGIDRRKKMSDIENLGKEISRLEKLCQPFGWLKALDTIFKYVIVLIIAIALLLTVCKISEQENKQYLEIHKFSDSSNIIIKKGFSK